MFKQIYQKTDQSQHRITINNQHISNYSMSLHKFNSPITKYFEMFQWAPTLNEMSNKALVWNIFLEGRAYNQALNGIIIIDNNSN